LLDELATWHSVRALAVTRMSDGEVSIGRAVKIQGRSGGACLEDGTHGVNNTYCRGIESAFRAKERAV
jgi:hypothetical protein